MRHILDDNGFQDEYYVAIIVTAATMSICVIFVKIEGESGYFGKCVTEDGRDACVGYTSLICSLVGLYIGNHYVDILVGVYIPVGDGYSAIAVYLGGGLYGLRAVGEEGEFSCAWPVVGVVGVAPVGSVEGYDGVFDVWFGFGAVCRPGFSVFKVECA